MHVPWSRLLDQTNCTAQPCFVKTKRAQQKHHQHEQHQRQQPFSYSKTSVKRVPVKTSASKASAVVPAVPALTDVRTLLHNSCLYAGPHRYFEQKHTKKKARKKKSEKKKYCGVTFFPAARSSLKTRFLKVSTVSALFNLSHWQTTARTTALFSRKHRKK